MDNDFFKRPILNSPYEYPTRYWELDEHGQPTQRISARTQTNYRCSNTRSRACGAVAPGPVYHP